LNKPGDWNFDQSVSFHSDVVSARKPIELFDASEHAGRLNRIWIKDSKVIPGDEKGKDYLYLNIKELVKPDVENPNGRKIADYSMRHYFGDLIQGRMVDMASKKKIVLDGYAANHSTYPIQFMLVMKNGSGFGSLVKLNSKKKRYTLALKKFKSMTPVLLPRPYPTFLPYYSNVRKAEKLDLNEVESFQISVGPGIKPADVNKAHELMVGRVWLE
jgi:hypothetical protein